MKINLKKISVEDIDGEITEKDFSILIGNAIFTTTKDIGELDLAREIYHNGEVDLTKEQAIVIKTIVDKTFLAWAKKPILDELDKIINTKE